MPLMLTLCSSVMSTIFGSMTLGRRKIYLHFVAMRNMTTVKRAKMENEKWRKGKTDERLIVLCSLLFLLLTWTMILKI